MPWNDAVRRDTLFLRGLRFWLPTIGGDGGDGGGVNVAIGINIGTAAWSIAFDDRLTDVDFFIVTLWCFFLSGDRPFFFLLTVLRLANSSKLCGRSASIFCSKSKSTTFDFCSIGDGLSSTIGICGNTISLAYKWSNVNGFWMVWIVWVGDNDEVDDDDDDADVVRVLERFIIGIGRWDIKAA